MEFEQLTVCHLLSTVRHLKFAIHVDISLPAVLDKDGNGGSKDAGGLLHRAKPLLDLF